MQIYASERGDTHEPTASALKSALKIETFWPELELVTQSQIPMQVWSGFQAITD